MPIDRKVLNKLTACIEEFRKLDPEMQAQQMNIFLFIAAHSECSMADLSQASGLSQSSVSRNVMSLSRKHRNRTPGHNVVESYEDYFDARVKRVRLTKRGERIINTLTRAIA